MKVLLWALVAFAVVMWLTHGKKQRIREEARNSSRNSSPPPSAGAIESMVRCAYCGTYVPASESVNLPSGMTFCCEEHRTRHASSDSAA